MKNFTTIILSILILFSSWGQIKIDKKKANSFFKAVNYQIDLNKPDQQEFINKLFFALSLVKENSDTIINTEDLQVLYESSKAKNIVRQANIEMLTEIDTQINYKNKVLDYIKTFNEAYENEFPRTIQILKEHTEDRFERTKIFLYPKLQMIKSKEIALTSSQREFRSKYLEINNSLSKSDTRRTGSDFEYIKLNEFSYSRVNIKDGTKIKLLSFSGGQDAEDGKISYSQFIGINNSNGDTLRVLALANKQHYDLDKQPQIGTFKSEMLIKNKSGDIEYIIFNKAQADIEKGNYKTVFGILNF